jgi:hypothetical protein
MVSVLFIGCLIYSIFQPAIALAPENDAKNDYTIQDINLSSTERRQAGPTELELQIGKFSNLANITGLFTKAESLRHKDRRGQKKGSILYSIAEKEIQRICDSGGVVPVENRLSNSRDADKTKWALYGFGAGVRTGHDSFGLPEEYRENSIKGFRSSAFAAQRKSLEVHGVAMVLGDAFYDGFINGWDLGLKAAADDAKKRVETTHIQDADIGRQKFKRITIGAIVSAKAAELGQMDEAESLTRCLLNTQFSMQFPQCQQSDFARLFQPPN